MNKKLKIILQVFFILLTVLGLTNVIANFHYGTEEQIETFQKPISVSGASKFVIDEKNILIGNNENSSIQVFNRDGNFLYGLRLPTSGGEFWMCKTGENLFIYSVRKNLYFKLLEQQCLEAKKVEFNDISDFYKESNFAQGDKQTKISLFLHNELTIEDVLSHTKDVIKINAPLLPLSIAFGFLAMLIGLIGIFIINGYFNRFLEKDNSIDNNDVVKYFKNYRNRLK